MRFARYCMHISHTMPATRANLTIGLLLWTWLYTDPLCSTVRDRIRDVQGLYILSGLYLRPDSLLECE